MSNRRNFIIALGGVGGLGLAFASPLRRLLKSLMKNESQRNFSRFSPQECRNYVQINHYGGPSRWFFDSILKPTDGQPFYSNPMIVNHLQSSTPLEFDYKFHKVGNINMPYLWKFDIPSSDGGEVPMSNLTKNMMTVRGVHLEGTLGHPINCAKMVAPAPGGLSIDGLVADLSTSPIPAVTIGNTPVNRAFKSRKSTVVRINTDEENYLKYLLDPFYHPDTTSWFEDKEEIKKIVDEAIEALKESKTTNSSLYSDLSKSRQFFNETIDGFLGEYDQLVKKYKTLIERSLTSTLKGINDKPIPGLSLPLNFKGKHEAIEALGKYVLEDHFLIDKDLRNILNGASFLYLAQEFAIAEYVISKGLSSSVVISTKSEMGHFFDNTAKSFAIENYNIVKEYDGVNNTTSFAASKRFTVGNPKSLNWSLDAHNTGLIPNFITTNQFFYSIATCLNELISSFKKQTLNGKNVFDETLIHLTAEFDRTPNQFLNGSGHNEHAHVSSFFSGAIESHTVLGNIYSEASGDKAEDFDDHGTIGNAAPVGSFNGQKIGISNLSSSISKILRIEPIVGRATPFLKLKNDKVVPMIASAENIEGVFSLIEQTDD
ncbi:MAG: hypothetical protein CME70_13540 [Halobacteriovorax sp.]|nr:hypothetical protein [Halobacteriovorax sp.]